MELATIRAAWPATWASKTAPGGGAAERGSGLTVGLARNWRNGSVPDIGTLAVRVARFFGGRVRGVGFYFFSALILKCCEECTKLQSFKKEVGNLQTRPPGGRHPDLQKAG